MQLVIPGNKNLKTIRSVVYFVKTYYNQVIEKVHFIDTRSSLYNNEGRNIEGERSEIVRTYIERVNIESSLLSEETLHIDIPDLLSKQLRIYSNDQIIVDLTNGNKYISSILYASASLSKIKNLFFLSVNPGKHNMLPEDLQEHDYSISVISPIENIESIGRLSYFEIIFYRDKTDELSQAFKKISFKSSFLQNMFEGQLNDAILYYFSGHFANAMKNFGSVIEEISTELCQRIKNKAHGEIERKEPKDFNDAIVWLQVAFCEPLRAKKGKNLTEYQEQLKHLQNIDKLISVIKEYRNLVSHPYDFLQGKEEARLVINTALYILTLISESAVFS